VAKTHLGYVFETIVTLKHQSASIVGDFMRFIFFGYESGGPISEIELLGIIYTHIV
jgi:hypothetical protein